ncbi:EAL domain-containing protein [Paenibacillus sp. TRM 82003]|nr:EAL domain-containing protein [Paenibacillus sp. TRM 82003]
MSNFFLSVRLVQQVRFDQRVERRDVSTLYILLLAFLFSHGMLGCVMTFYESFGIIPNIDYYLVEFASLLLMIACSVIHGERQFWRQWKRLEWNNKRLREIAYHDSLTGLPNRMYAMEYLGERVSSGTPCYVFLIDLDHFKNVNDLLGHQAGDYLLSETSDRLRRATPAGDMVSRLGGDEFLVVVTTSTSEAQVLRLAERIIAEITKPLEYAEQRLLVTTSIGIARYPGDADTAEEAIKHADIAMYKAKEKGRDTYHLFSKRHDQETLENLQMKQELKSVLDRRDLELYFQPKMRLSTDAIVGVEALLRWNHANGQIPPGKFIALAEQNGTIVPIGEWVLAEACAHMKAWNERFGARLTVAVNVSFEQLRKDDFIERLETILIKSGLAPELLELEITESAAMRDVERTIELMRRIRERGVRVSIDDFGTGFSSLSYLKRFAFDRIKLDRSFISELPGDDKNGAIVRTILTLAKQLSAETTAEGVETPEQLAYLREHGCEEAQGYLFYKPMSAADLAPVLAKTIGEGRAERGV